VQGSYHEDLKDWRGYLVLAIDGSHIALSRDARLREYYGATGHEWGAVTARASLLYDRENDIIVDARLEPLGVDERTLAKEHVDALAALELGGRKAVVLFDRGYPSKDLITYVQDTGLKYVMRVQRGFNFRIDAMSGGSGVIELSGGLRTRAVVFWLSRGEREGLITNLEEEEAGDEAIAELYYRRWAIETKYQQVKQKLELENFSGRLEENIKQDFYALMTVSNMLASCLGEANGKGHVRQGTEEVPYEYRVNVNHAVGVLKDRLIGVVITDDPFARKYLYRELVAEMRRRLVPVRPNRAVRRKDYLRKPHFHHNHKSNC
jgi:hypothetical protein